MKRTSLLHVVLGLIALAALTAYIVACRASWSPDGSQILYPYFNTKTKNTGIALFDRTTGKTRSVLELASESGSGSRDPILPWVQWDRSGTRAIVMWLEDIELKHNDEGDGTFTVLALPLKAQEPARMFVVKGARPGIGWPLPEVEGKLIAYGKSIVFMDLETGATERHELQEDQKVVLTSHHDHIAYARETSADKDALEIGMFDPKRFTFTPSLTVHKEDLGEWMGSFEVSHDGSVVALGTSKNGTLQVNLAGTSLSKSIPLDLTTEDTVLGNLQWAPGGKKIYAALISRTAEHKTYQLGIAEITIETGTHRVVPVLTARSDIELKSMPMLFQIALSPDGKTIAAAPTFLEREPDADEGFPLHLVDLTSTPWKVTTVPLPTPQGPPAKE